MEWQRLETLKQKLQAEDDFQGVFQYFFDHLAEKPAFISEGIQASVETLKLLTPVIENTVGHIVNETVTIIESNLSDVRDHHFFHGPVVTSAGICILLYFDDIKVGMIYFLRGMSAGLVHYGRFTTISADANGTVILPTRNQTSH